MRHSKVSGTYYDMGFRNGSLLYKHGYPVPKMPRETLAFGKKLKEFSPTFWMRYEASPTLAMHHYRHLASFIFSIGTLKPAACSVFAVDNGFEIIFGRNYDFYYRFKRHSRSFLTKPS